MSKKDDLINSYGGVSGIMAQTPDAKARIRNELLEAARQDAIEANSNAEKAANGSLTNDLVGIGGSLAGIGGGTLLGNSLFGGGAGAGALAGAAPAAPIILPTVGSTAAGVSGTAAAGALPGGLAGGAGIGSSLMAAAPFIGGAVAAGGAYDIGKNLISERKMGTGHGALSGAATGGGIGTMIMPGLGTAIGAGAGAIGGAILGQFGHSNKFFQGEDREGLANKINEKYGPGTLDAKTFRNDPGSFSYDLKSPGVNKELGAAQALTALLTGEKFGSKMWGDLGSRFANDVKNGKSVKDLYSQYGLDYEKASQGINSSAYDQQQKATLQNGLNEAFGAQPRSNSSQGSPGRRPQTTQSKTPKQKAKSTSDALSKLWKV